MFFERPPEGPCRQMNERLRRLRLGHLPLLAHAMAMDGQIKIAAVAEQELTRRRRGSTRLQPLVPCRFPLATFGQDI